MCQGSDERGRSLATREQEEWTTDFSLCRALCSFRATKGDKMFMFNDRTTDKQHRKTGRKKPIISIQQSLACHAEPCVRNLPQLHPFFGGTAAKRLRGCKPHAPALNKDSKIGRKLACKPSDSEQSLVKECYLNKPQTVIAGYALFCINA